MLSCHRFLSGHLPPAPEPTHRSPRAPTHGQPLGTALVPDFPSAEGRGDRHYRRIRVQAQYLTADIGERRTRSREHAARFAFTDNG